MKTLGRSPLTPTQIERLKPDSEIADTREPGLRVRVTANGVRSFRWAVREAGKLRWVTLGRFAPSPAVGFLTLREARSWLGRLKDAHHAGELAKVEAELSAHLQPGQVAQAGARTVGDVAAQFWKLLDTRRKRKSDEAAGIYRLYVEKEIGAVPLAALKKSQCVAMFQRASAQRAKVIAITKQLLAHAEMMDDDFVNPAARLRASDFGVTSRSRKRWLSAEEIAAFWKALEVEGPGGTKDETRVERLKTAAALRLLLLTGLRTSELRLAEWADVDLVEKTLTIPVKNQKLTPKQAEQAHPFVVPLSTTAIRLLEGVRQLDAGKPRWVLTSAGGSPYAEKTFGRFMKRLWRGEKQRARTPHPLLEQLEPATPHDLRRTARSWLGRLGVAPHIAERCLNHRLGRIVETYDRHDYLGERRGALELWDSQIQTLTRSTKGTK